MFVSNLASIEATQIEIYYAIPKMAKSFPLESWLPLLDKWNNTLKGACKELQSLKLFNNDQLTLTKEELIESIDESLTDINDHSDFLRYEKKEEKINEEFERICEQVVNEEDLFPPDLYTIMRVSLDKLLERLEEDNYLVFNELCCIDIIKAKLEKKPFEKNDNKISTLINNQEGKSKKTKQRNPNQPLSYMQMAWVMVLRGESYFQEEHIKEKYSTYDSLTLYKRKGLILKVNECIKGGERPTKSRSAIINDLNLVINYFETLNEIDPMNTAIERRKETVQKLAQEKEENRN